MIESVLASRSTQLGLPLPLPMRIRRNTARSSAKPAAALSGMEEGSRSIPQRARALTDAMGARLKRASVVSMPSNPLTLYLSPCYDRLPPTAVAVAGGQGGHESAAKPTARVAAARRPRSVRAEVEQALLSCGGAGAILTDDPSAADAVLILLTPGVFNNAELVGELFFTLADRGKPRQVRSNLDSAPFGTRFIWLYSTAVPFAEYIHMAPRHLKEVGLLESMYDKFPRSVELQHVAAEHAIAELPTAEAALAAAEAAARAMAAKAEGWRGPWVLRRWHSSGRLKRETQGGEISARGGLLGGLIGLMFGSRRRRRLLLDRADAQTSDSSEAAAASPRPRHSSVHLARRLTGSVPLPTAAPPSAGEPALQQPRDRGQSQYAAYPALRTVGERV